MQLGHSGIVVYIFLIFLEMSFLELGHFRNTLHNCSHATKFNVKYTKRKEISRSLKLVITRERQNMLFTVYEQCVLQENMFNEKLENKKFISHPCERAFNNATFLTVF